MKGRSTLGLLLLSLVSIHAFAGGAGVGLAEPGVMELLAIGAAVGVAVAIRNRRKK
jgi:hypothetical protein